MKTILSDIPLTITSQKHSLHVFDPVVLQNGKPCVGCFSCWLKTPGSCIYQDAITDFTRIMKDSETLYILTHNQYGSYSPLVKCAIDRSLSYVQPYFTIRNQEMHHVLYPTDAFSSSSLHMALPMHRSRPIYPHSHRRMESIWDVGISSAVTV